jgi:hypothetical protein
MPLINIKNTRTIQNLTRIKNLFVHFEAVGLELGLFERVVEGRVLRLLVGAAVGRLLIGAKVGSALGMALDNGDSVGLALGVLLGEDDVGLSEVRLALGLTVGLALGVILGFAVGLTLGLILGFDLGLLLGLILGGDAVGIALGVLVVVGE